MPILWSSLIPSASSDVRPGWAPARAPEDADTPRTERVAMVIVSRERAALLSLLKRLLSGSPEIEIGVDRRIADRRCGASGPVAQADRRRRERRRRTPVFVH